MHANALAQRSSRLARAGVLVPVGLPMTVSGCREPAQVMVTAGRAQS